MFENLTIPIPCPRCGHKTKKTGRWLKANKHFACPGCGIRINIDSSKFFSAEREVHRKLDAFGRDFKRAFSCIGKVR